MKDLKQKLIEVEEKLPGVGEKLKGHSGYSSRPLAFNEGHEFKELTDIEYFETPEFCGVAAKWKEGADLKDKSGYDRVKFKDGHISLYYKSKINETDEFSEIETRSLRSHFWSSKKGTTENEPHLDSLNFVKIDIFVFLLILH